MLLEGWFLKTVEVGLSSCSTELREMQSGLWEQAERIAKFFMPDESAFFLGGGEGRGGAGLKTSSVSQISPLTFHLPVHDTH